MTSRDEWVGFAIRGYSPWSAEKIAREALRGLPPDEIPGDFVVTARSSRAGEERHVIVTSPVAALPYFYTVANGRFCHGATVFDVVRSAGLPWRWNERAVRCLAWLGHTFGSDTLHADVRRVPFDAIMRFENGRLNVIARGFWKTVLGGPVVSLDDAVSVFAAVSGEMLRDQPVLAMSGGFDSRVILAQFLRAGIEPALITMGPPDSTDRLVASAIARDHGLRHHVVELRPSEYLAHARTIVQLTSGTKTARHWHAYFLGREAAGLATGPLFGGTNGEFARTYYLDLGAPAKAFDLGPAVLAAAYFGARLERRRRRFHLPLPFLRDTGLATALSIARDIAEVVVGPRSALDALDFFYASQRVRHFIGNGMALCSAFKPSVSPFLEPRWIRAAGHLRRTDKMGSRFHRRAIAENAPRLLEYPVHAEERVAPRPTPLYWLRRSREVGYDVFAEVIDLPHTREILLDSTLLDEFGPRSERERVMRERHVESIEFLLTLHFAAEAARDSAAHRLAS